MEDTNKYPPFITGSHAYGLPNDKSDIDLVVLVDLKTHSLLMDVCDNRHDLEEPQDPDYGAKCDTYSLRFGKLNLLVCTDVKQYITWKIGTRKLKKQKPVNREFACAFMDRLRKRRAKNN